MSQPPKKPPGLVRHSVQFSIQQGEDGTIGVHVEMPPGQEAEGDDDMKFNPSLKWLSPLGVRIVRLMCESNWLTREDIAAKLGEAPDGKLAAILTDLAERCWIDSSPRKGYMLAIPEDVKPDEYRVKVLVWLGQQEKPPC